MESCNQILHLLTDLENMLPILHHPCCIYRSHFPIHQLLKEPNHRDRWLLMRLRREYQHELERLLHHARAISDQHQTILEILNIYPIWVFHFHQPLVMLQYYFQFQQIIQLNLFSNIFQFILLIFQKNHLIFIQLHAYVM